MFRCTAVRSMAAADISCISPISSISPYTHQSVFKRPLAVLSRDDAVSAAPKPVVAKKEMPYVVSVQARVSYVSVRKQSYSAYHGRVLQFNVGLAPLQSASAARSRSAVEEYTMDVPYVYPVSEADGKTQAPTAPPCPVEAGDYVSCLVKTHRRSIVHCKPLSNDAVIASRVREAGRSKILAGITTSGLRQKSTPLEQMHVVDWSLKFITHPE
eukprot:Rhum_TRINITY_DN23286_c0_g1::Rhum_TRINITY_DN23286_c0_g1_i1::g.177608::m.177608